MFLLRFESTLAGHNAPRNVLLGGGSIATFGNMHDHTDDEGGCCKGDALGKDMAWSIVSY
jgi:hypothetical protein